MQEFFKEYRFGDNDADLLQRCLAIIERYQKMGLRLTLRQLYYRLVAATIIPNTERSYKRVGHLVSRARLTGIVDWEAIEDRGRLPEMALEWETPQSLVAGACQGYRLPRWRDQPNYVELWVEKDALSGILWPLAHEHHVVLSVNKGYNSQSSMYRSAKRFEYAQEAGKRTVLLYLGDHDPSGEDMVRDIRDRMEVFRVAGADRTHGDAPGLEVRKIALTMPQIKKYKPPPNPTKPTDSRTPGYIKKHGKKCWEVDALDPPILQRLIQRSIVQYIDKAKMERWKKREQKHVRALKRATKKVRW